MDVLTSPRTLLRRSAAPPARPVPAAPLWLTLLLAAVLVAATLMGLAGDLYRDTPAREFLGATLRGQDALTLLCVPVLVWAAIRARGGSLPAHIVWLGVLLYVPYTYLMYVVVPYNDAFLLYVAAIGLGFYLFMGGLLRMDVRALAPTFVAAPRRGTGWFLMVAGGTFALLWLVQNLTVLPGGVPDGLFVYDIPSTVHVMDLAFILPLVIGSGFLLVRGHPAGPVLAGVMLVKMVTLGLALLAMNIGGTLAGAGANVGEAAAWLAIAAVAVAFLWRGRRRLGPTPPNWLWPSLW